MHMKHENMQSYLDDLLSKGELIFSKKDAVSVLQITDAAFRNSINRKKKAKKIMRLMKGFYLIIPAEYQKLGSVPPELFIDDLMQYLGINYYVALISAASFYGATHQASQKLQIMVEKPIKNISTGRATIEFLTNKKLSLTPTNQFKTDRGDINVSTAEATCFELLKYIRQSGNLNYIITLLQEISAELNQKKLCDIAKNYSLISIQRLGYLFDLLEQDKISIVLQDYLKIHKPLFYEYLNPNAKKQGIKNKKWHLIINDRVESDL